jgi:hypothetical protein
VALALSDLTIIAQSEQAADIGAAAAAAVHKAWSHVPGPASVPTIDLGTVRDAAGRPVPGGPVHQAQSLTGTQEER